MAKQRLLGQLVIVCYSELADYHQINQPQIQTLADTKIFLVAKHRNTLPHLKIESTTQGVGDRGADGEQWMANRPIRT